MAASVEELEVICWEDLGCEAVMRRLTVRDLPLTVILDAHGGDLYERPGGLSGQPVTLSPQFFTFRKEGGTPMFTCASCTIEACRSGQLDKLPKNCPMRDPAFFDSVLEEYFSRRTTTFVASAATEAIGYCRWPRLREVVEFSRRMGYTRLGLAFCAGLHQEAEVVDRVLRRNGFQVASVICKTGSIPKDQVGVPPEYRVRPGTYEVMCNPIAQAELLNRAETQFNICLGLCVGHDSLFYRYSQAPVTTPGSQGPGHRQQPCGRHLLRRQLLQDPPGRGPAVT